METTITCPQCGAEIRVSEGLAHKVREDLARQLRHEHETQLKKAAAEAEAGREKAVAEAREQSLHELTLARNALAEQRKKTEQAQKAELALRQEKGRLEERARELDLEVARKVDGEKAKLADTIRKSFAEEQSLKLKEKDKQIDDLKRLLEEARRKSEQGSQEMQGEVLELDIQAALEQQFPHDRIEPVRKGARGADIVQRVVNGRMEDCGSIVWETKNTKHWAPAWIEKLKEDQRAAGAALAVLVSAALPDEVLEFGQISGVWVASLRAWPALAAALREQLIQVAFARRASEGKNEKMDLMYAYLAGDEFRHRVEAIVETFTAMQTQLQRERRAMEKLWKEREKQIERITMNTVGMYGEMRGIIGTSLPEIPALTLEEVGGLLEADVEGGSR